MSSLNPQAKEFILSKEKLDQINKEMEEYMKSVEENIKSINEWLINYIDEGFEEELERRNKN